MEKYIEIESPSGRLRGMIHYPDSGEGTYPVLIVFHGFQSNRMGSDSLFVALSRFLTGNGIASVRFDFSGSGESDGSYLELTVTRLLDEALSIIEWTAKQPAIDSKRIALCGHSMGGSIAGMLAGLMERSGIRDTGIHVDRLVLLAPAGEIIDRIGEEAASRGLPAAFDSDTIEKMKFPVVFGTESFSKEFFIDLKRHRVMEETSRYTGPALLIQGDDDRAVSSNIALAYIEACPSMRLRLIKGAGHNFGNPVSRLELFGLVAEHIKKSE